MTKQLQKELKKTMAPYEKANLKNSVWQIVNTVFPFFLLWYLAYESLSISYLLTLGLNVLAAGFIVRTFIIFHDCCHNSFFKNKRANEVVGTITGILTLFPFQQWRHSHNVHHATSSNLNKRGTGDIWVMTVEEYANAPFGQRLAYRLYRNPIVMFGIGPIYLFLVTNRFNRKDARVKERMNTYLINLSVVLLYGMMCWIVGWQAFLLIQGPILFIAGSLGIWLFYVQHHFEDSYFAKDEDWDFVKAAVEGSSFYKLPKLLQWLTGNIGYHHVHHLSPRVPNYHLEEAHNNNVPLKSVPTVTIRSSLRAVQYRLWDEENKKFVCFQTVKKSLARQKLTQKVLD
ncbi:fatty acid desaturase [Bacillus sp. V3B]|uniref:fatty acid desaturase n=1 Tax=Bacillus sp. V3B TaxID=2804915 RepID=UPI00210DDF74|nr:fatty acid desaturase [Bacillus sp. V3B]MCQ6276281.1 fatty acid desaturase [Bacillus sp. V3B]